LFRNQLFQLAKRLLKKKTNPFLLIGLLMTAIGFGMYFYVVYWPYARRAEVPVSTIRIGVSPSTDMNVTKTRFTANVSKQPHWILIMIEFEFKRFQNYYAYVILPYEVTNSWPMQSSNYTFSKPRGAMLVGHRYFKSYECSVVNISYTPNEADPSRFHFGQTNNEEFGALIEVENLIAFENYAKRTVILTFFGYLNYPTEAEKYIPRNATEEVLDKPFEVYVVFPNSFTMSSDTFPPPLTTFTTREDRLAFWSLNFTYPPPGHAQSISCSFISEAQLQIRDQLVFLSGILIGVGFPVFIDSLRRSRQPGP